VSSAPEKEILAGVREVLRDELERRVEIGPETELLRDLELDSLALVTLVAELENRFRIVLAEEESEAAAIVTVGDLVAHVRARIDAGRSGRV
jgi:acyl carrier protein